MMAPGPIICPVLLGPHILLLDGTKRCMRYRTRRDRPYKKVDVDLCPYPNAVAIEAGSRFTHGLQKVVDAEVLDCQVGRTNRGQGVAPHIPR